MAKKANLTTNSRKSTRRTNKSNSQAQWSGSPMKKTRKRASTATKKHLNDSETNLQVESTSTKKNDRDDGHCSTDSIIMVNHSPTTNENVHQPDPITYVEQLTSNNYPKSNLPNLFSNLEVLKNFDENVLKGSAKEEQDHLLPLSSLRSNYLADLTIEEIEIDQSELINEVNETSQTEEEILTNIDHNKEFKTDIDYKKLLNEFKLDLKNCLNSGLSNQSADGDGNFNKLAHILQQSPDHSIEKAETSSSTTNNKTPKSSPSLRLRFQSQHQCSMNKANSKRTSFLQSTPLVKRASTTSTTIDDQTFFMDDDMDHDLNELLGNLENSSKTKVISFLEETPCRIKSTIRLPKTNHKPFEMLSFHQIVTYLQ